MTKAIFEDLEPVENLLIRCDRCDTPFVTEHQLNQHISIRHAGVEVEGINHQPATDW